MSNRPRPYYKYNLRSLPSAERRGALSAVGKLKHHWRQTLPKFALGQINPFDPNVKGARVPDQNTAPSDTFYAQDETGVSVQTTNFAQCKAFMPCVRHVLAQSNVSSTTGWSWPALYGGKFSTGNLTSIEAQFQLYRPVSHGVKIQCATSNLNAEGYVHVALYSASTRDSTWLLPENINEMSECPYYKRIPLAQLSNNGPLYVVNKYMDPSAHVYRDITYTAAQSSENEFMTTFGWMTILVAVTGVTNNSSVLVENIAHFEGTLRKTAFGQARSAEPSDTVLYDSVTQAVSTSNPIVQTIDDLTRAPMHVAEFVDDMANAIGNSALGQTLGMIIPAPVSAAMAIPRAGIRAVANISRYARSRRASAASQRNRRGRAAAVRANRVGRTYDASADAL